MIAARRATLRAGTRGAQKARHQPRSWNRSPSRILAIDIGGTGLKAAIVAPDGKLLSERRRVPTPYPCPPPVMLEALIELARPFEAFDRIAAGFPGVVRQDKVLTAPHFGTREWSGFPLSRVLSRELGGMPARTINDAEMQGLAVIAGRGIELVLTLGTGAGTALFREGQLMPHLELAHHPVHKNKTYNEYIGNAARKKAGNKRWNRRMAKVIDILDTLINYDHLYLGGGNARRVSLDLPDNVSVVSNEAGLEGGGRLWSEPTAARTA
jgi:polyphosphate glucokinase